MGLYTYSVIKTSWGISVTIDAAMEEHRTHSEDCIEINNKLCVVDRSENKSRKEKDFLLLGVRLVADQVVNSAIGDDRVAVVVRDISHNIVDFQEEGVTCAIMGLLADELGFPVTETNVTYDPVLNKYNFEFPKSMAESEPPSINT
jgi:hypothetical protein